VVVADNPPAVWPDGSDRRICCAAIALPLDIRDLRTIYRHVN